MLENFNIGEEEGSILPDTIQPRWLLSPEPEKPDELWEFHSLYSVNDDLPSLHADYSLTSPQMNYSFNLDSHISTSSATIEKTFPLKPSSTALDDEEILKQTQKVQLRRLTPLQSDVTSNILKQSLINIGSYNLDTPSNSLIANSDSNLNPKPYTFAVPNQQEFQPTKVATKRRVERNRLRDSSNSFPSVDQSKLREWARAQIQSNEENWHALTQRASASVSDEQYSSSSSTCKSRFLSRPDKIKKNLQLIQSELNCLQQSVTALRNLMVLNEQKREKVISRQIITQKENPKQRKRGGKRLFSKKEVQNQMATNYAKMFNRMVKTIPNRQSYFEYEWSRLMRNHSIQPSHLDSLQLNDCYRALPMFGMRKKTFIEVKDGSAAKAKNNYKRKLSN